MCGPHRGRFRAVNLSASGSFVFVVGRRGDLFTRLLRLRHLRPRPGLLQVLLRGPARQGRRRADPAPRRAAGSSSRRSRAAITSAISIHKVGRRRGPPRSSASRASAAARPATGSATSPPRAARAGRSTRPASRSTGERAPQPAPRHLARGPRAERGTAAYGDAGELLDFNVYCSPAAHPQGREDALRAAPRRRPAPAGARPRPRRRAAHAVRRDRGGRQVHDVTVQATRDEVAIEELGWTFSR